MSLNSLRLLAAMVSSTRELFPEPETPVNTVILYLGISNETSFWLFSLAPRMLIVPVVIDTNHIFIESLRLSPETTHKINCTRLNVRNHK